MTTIVTRASAGQALTWQQGDQNLINLNNDKIESVVEDTTPQLGGNLDVNGNKIVSVSNGNIVIEPNGAGAIVLDGLSWPQADGTTGQFLTTDGEGLLSWADGGSSGTLAIEDGGTGATTAIDAWRNLQTYEAFNISVSLTNASAYVQNVYGSGGITVTLPETDTLSLGQGFLITNTSSEGIFVRTYTDIDVTVLEPGRAMEITVSNTSSDAADSWQFYKQGFNNVVQDTAPQLGGNLDLNSYGIDGEYVQINGTANIQLSVNDPEFGSSSLAIGPTSIQLSSPTGSINLDGANWPKLSYTDPLTGVVTAIDDVADPNTLTLDNYTGINVNDPIVFSGTEVTSIGLTENVTYYISADLGSGTYELAEYPSGPNIVLTDIGTITDVNYTVTITISNVSGGEVLTYQSGTLSWQAPSGITNVVDDTTPQLGGNLDTNGNDITTASSLTIAAGSLLTTYSSITISNTGGISLSADPSGSLSLNSLIWPSSDGTSGQVLTTNGSGSLSWTTVSGGITDVVQDTTPQLGGNLDVNGKSIVSVSNGNIVLAPNGTGKTKITNINYNETPYTLTYGATITPDVANGNVQIVTLTGNVTFSAFANPVSGQSLTLIVKQDATGNRTLTSTMKFAGGTKTLSPAANSVDIISVFYDGTNYWASLSTDFK